jgi:DNA repair ATPase RecN
MEIIIMKTLASIAKDRPNSQFIPFDIRSCFRQGTIVKMLEQIDSIANYSGLLSPKPHYMALYVYWVQQCQHHLDNVSSLIAANEKDLQIFLTHIQSTQEEKQKRYDPLKHIESLGFQKKHTQHHLDNSDSDSSSSDSEPSSPLSPTTTPQSSDRPASGESNRSHSRYDMATFQKTLKYFLTQSIVHSSTDQVLWIDYCTKDPEETEAQHHDPDSELIVAYYHHQTKTLRWFKPTEGELSLFDQTQTRIEHRKKTALLAGNSQHLQKTLSSEPVRVAAEKNQLTPTIQNLADYIFDAFTQPSDSSTQFIYSFSFHGFSAIKSEK